MRKRILIIEDDVTLARILLDNLLYEGFEVDWISDGLHAVHRAREFGPDLAILDIMLPGVNGLDLCGPLRQGGRTAVILLTVRSQKEDKLRGFNSGADDYVTKPFDLDELLARVHVVLRRSRLAADRLTMGPVIVDLRTREARRGMRTLRLTHKEFELLRYLSEREGQVVHRTELLRDVWGYPDLPNTRSVDHAIARLRKKIERDTHRPQFIHTVHGDGYCLTLSVPDSVPSREGSTNDGMP